tara:strand:+ start:716 stop:997 length:282 start_codon:yes stop_codon:yes gene_type:complete
MYEGSENWAKWLIVEPTLEQELQLEADALAIMEEKDPLVVSSLCAALSKQVWYQKQIISQSIGRVAELEARLISKEIKGEKSLIAKFKKHVFP